MKDEIAKLAGELLALADSDLDSLLVVTGAGVSVASGVPTFRGGEPDAVWARDTTEKGTRRFFESDPVASWSWYLSRFEKVTGASVNPAHQALVQLERWQLQRGGGFLLATQNIDGLHRQAGSQELVEVHGRADRIRCSHDGCKLGSPTGAQAANDVDLAPFRAAPSLATLPRCPLCSSLFRPHVLWFDERYDQHADYQLGRVLYAAKRAGIVIFAGTSFAVGITAMVLELASDNAASVYSIDPTPRHANRAVRDVVAPAELAFPALMASLG